MRTYYIHPAIISACQPLPASSFTSTDEKTGKQFNLIMPTDRLKKQANLLLRLQPFNEHNQVRVHLINPAWDDQGVCRPHSVILMPDWLIDVTRVCTTMQGKQPDSILTLLSRYKLSRQSLAMLIGNMCNALMARLAAQPTLDFQSLLPVLFRQFGLSLALLDDDELQTAMQQLHIQFENIRLCLTESFPNLQINPNNLVIEPTYFCPAWGLQGRPDFQLISADQNSSDTIELKSGKPFAPNKYGLNTIHQVQTALYSVMASAGHSSDVIGRNFILYAGTTDSPLRPAPIPTDGLLQSTEARNACVVADIQMCTAIGHKELLDNIVSGNFTPLSGFLAGDAQAILHIYQNLSDVEQAFWHEYGAFIHREHAFARLGDGSGKNGQQLLWKTSVETKQDAGRIATPLSILHIHQHEKATILILDCTKVQHIPFRKGDIAVLYSPGNTPWDAGQMRVHRCNVIEVNSDNIVIKLRTRQHYTAEFQKRKTWCLEVDSLDSSFNQMYIGLMEFASAPQAYRQRYLGLKSPDFPEQTFSFEFKNTLSSNQQEVVSKALNAHHHFLIWGPPGTGKTTLILSEITWQFLQQTSGNIMLLAFTNRAVDEICQALLNTDPALHPFMVRIGSSSGTTELYHPFLLDEQLKNCRTRQDILDLLGSKRIFIATIAAISHSAELFALCKWHTVVIDEASQVPEPMVAGLLSRFSKWIMIGDHLQLPAVTLAPDNQCVISNPTLLKYGIEKTNMSVFERIFRQTTRQKWPHTFGILSEQGRLHASLLTFPNSYFYNNLLTIPSHSIRQISTTYFERYPGSCAPLKDRKLLIHCEEKAETTVKKRSNAEARKCLDIIALMRNLYRYNDKKIHSNAIGVICPFKSQAGLIQTMITHEHPDIAQLITCDTIERFQGSTKDIVIISFAVHQTCDLDGIISLSADGMDRKLNVAITRAREQIILIGNTHILKTNKTYEALLASYTAFPELTGRKSRQKICGEERLESVCDSGAPET